ncbi:maternal B9.15 protein-like [Saccostrea echinata]|uniref:maternal B9.15 protein-like n=1 Tax=Saccostrea echinata TaxID=191078 RepID=UPI002A7F5222|nr:maternal B9.15 protein-like [Saccostrea echinata]
MREEIGAAVLFITRLIRLSGSVSKEKVVEFSDSLSAILNEKFTNHWYQDHPAKGQGYRCIRINSAEPIDPVLEEAARNSGLQYHDLRLPSELTLWVDPKDVCCRFGESRGSFCTLATTKDGNLENMAHSINIEELLRQETERHNQQVNIVTTRTNMNVSQAKFTKGIHNANYYSKFQNNFYNNQQFQNTHNRFRPQNKNNRKQAQHEEQVNGVRVSPDHVNEVRQQFMDQVNSIVKEGEKVCEPKPMSPNTANSSSSKNAKTDTSSKAPLSNSTKSTPRSNNDNETTKSNTGGLKSTIENSKPSSDKSSMDVKSNRPSQAKGRYQPDQNTSVKPGSYNGGKGTHWLNRTHSKFNSQKVY